MMVDTLVTGTNNGFVRWANRAQIGRIGNNLLLEEEMVVFR
jgi:hypothetical protein